LIFDNMVAVDVAITSNYLGGKAQADSTGKFLGSLHEPERRKDRYSGPLP